MGLLNGKRIGALVVICGMALAGWALDAAAGDHGRGHDRDDDDERGHSEAHHDNGLHKGHDKGPDKGKEGGDHDRFERVPVAHSSLVAKECGACHIAFPSRLLPADSWQGIMGNLANHFGENASLPAAVVAEITAELLKDASPKGDHIGRPVMRISDQGWWQRAHRYDVSPNDWKKAGSKANCKACHSGAERGNFER